jgi:ribosomal protein L24
MEAPVHFSNVQLVDKNGKPTRVTRVRTTSGDKTIVKRIAKTTQEEL